MKKVLLLIIVVILFLISIKTTKNNTSSKTNVNQFKNIKHYKYKLRKRYLNYYKKNKYLSLDDVVTQVNIGLDYTFYTNISKSPYLNKPYLLVNKYFYLEKDYIPNNLIDLDEEYSKNGIKLVKEAKEMFEKMYEDAKKEGYTIRIISSYRSYNYQKYLYNNYKNKYGEEEANKYSAKPGFSEHQTGLCIDIDNRILNYEQFDKTESYKWMKKNSYKYGYIERYPKQKERITGYTYEPWHYRYVGLNIAKFINANNITFDEYYVTYINHSANTILLI